ncbi:MED14-domain-containing protein [Laetiporus sulphureus 93-53]|uniref:Mediator of RNA polymerase II transcription subunit 14 n=1 Tax=Laetiporus sulphureus 93-53 TaxID=1314785 RepID=A0A165DEE0_9APHY|nr:MED14-domain-containing protein [Laetiporus sulphureus 93-53]KZT04699.1 MED14-domain-containing protein [Laetiporus sulphureus 93-53]
MEPNGVNGHIVHITDGPSHINSTHEPTVEELEHALPMVQNDMIPLGELLSRMAQTIYAELSELAETLPNMSDTARKRTLADWVVATKKQVVKLYAVVKWSRDAGIVQKAMNITTFLMEQNNQFLRAQDVLLTHRDTLNAARMRNHDLLTSLDVLTTGSYRRLPSKIKRLVIPPIPLTDDEVKHTLEDVEDAIRFRLRMIEIIPPEMSSYRIADGRVSFFVPKLFEVSLCLRGAKKDDGWFFVNVEFLFNIGGDRTGLQAEFPRKPVGILRRHITDEADARLAFYLPLPPDQPPLPPGVEIPPRPQLPEGITDAPLVRVYNMLQMMSLSYQLEILWFQAERLRSLGWADFLTVEMTNSRQTMVVSYWIRKPPSKIPGRQPPPIPLLGGRLTISIVRVPAAKNNKDNRSPKARVLAELQEKAKLDVKRPSDEVEPLQFEVKWEPVVNALGISVPAQDIHLSQAELAIDSDNLDFESLLRKVLAKHSEAILKVIQHQLQNGNETRAMFSPPGEITLVVDEGLLALRTHLCADEVVIITIDPRTGQLNLRDMGDLAAAGRGRRYAFITAMVNMDPRTLPYRLLVLKRNTIIDNARQKANYIGLQTFSTRNFPPEELSKIGRSREDMLYIQLAKFPNHYLVLVIADEDFRYALISVEVQQNENDMFPQMAMRDVGWLDVKRIHGDEIIVAHADGADAGVVGQKRKRGLHDEGEHLRSIEQYTRRFNLETHTLREIYAFCCARVAYTKIEQQFKSRSIPYTTVDASNIAKIPELALVQSTLTRSIPALCVQSSDILSGAPAAEAAMPNIRIIPLHWWSENQAQVVTCVKLKYVQQPIGKRASSSSSIIRPSKRIIYDTTEAIVSFLSEDVDKCVDEFLEEWGRVSKMVVVAREVAQMSQKYRWSDVRLLSFDLQTVEFAYSGDYTVSITCVDQLSLTGGSYELTFSRVSDTDTIGQKPPDGGSSYNPHEDLEPYLCTLLRHGRLSASLHTLVALLRDTLPIVLELEDIRSATSRSGDNVDVFPKSAYWFRILYGDLRHALDFRLMTEGRVLVMDGAFSLFAAEDSSGKLVGLNNQSPSKPTPLYRSAPDRAADTSLLLQPIADFPAMISEVLKSVGSAGVSGRVTPIDIGMICDAPAVRAVGKALHDRILQRLAR